MSFGNRYFTWTIIAPFLVTIGIAVLLLTQSTQLDLTTLAR